MDLTKRLDRLLHMYTCRCYPGLISIKIHAVLAIYLVIFNNNRKRFRISNHQNMLVFSAPVALWATLAQGALNIIRVTLSPTLKVHIVLTCLEAKAPTGIVRNSLTFT